MSLRRLPTITAEQENFRLERDPSSGFSFVRRDPVEPVPVGTYVVEVYKVVGYDRDVDGSLMARLESVDRDGEETGSTQGEVGLYPDTVVVVDHPRDLFELVEQDT